MQIEIALRGSIEHVAVIRPDGSGARFTIPRKGPVSHDAVHFFVESELRLAHGFWGSVASGEDPNAIQERAKAGGHASANRAQTPDPDIVPLLQAERLVECFEAESLSGAPDDGGLLAMAEAGWCASHVPPLDITPAQICAIRQRLDAFAEVWKTLPEGVAAKLTWEEGE